MRELLQNQILVCCVIAWTVAQLLKILTYWLLNKELDWSRIIGDGGYPSAHSAFVTALAVSCALECGLNSVSFAISTVLALIVMHDARGVRLQTGKQARVINEIVGLFSEGERQTLTTEKLKEMVGHTFSQVIAGFFVGLVVSLIYFAV